LTGSALFISPLPLRHIPFLRKTPTKKSIPLFRFSLAVAHTQDRDAVLLRCAPGKQNLIGRNHPVGILPKPFIRKELTLFSWSLVFHRLQYQRFKPLSLG
jgi:hypothetical protein